MVAGVEQPAAIPRKNQSRGAQSPVRDDLKRSRTHIINDTAVIDQINEFAACSPWWKPNRKTHDPPTRLKSVYANLKD